jgi:hypothetical protein
MSTTTTHADLASWLDAALEPHWAEAGTAWWAPSLERVGAGLSGSTFGATLSVASRHTPRVALDPGVDALTRAHELLPGWNPERWDVLEAARVRLLLARPDLEKESFALDLETLCQHADEGELRAIYKSLALLSKAERFSTRAAEGCRTNIVPVFESVACDTPFPFTYFDDLAWNQMLIKGLFIGAPLVRIVGLDRRLNPELARMALDLAEERRSAGRQVQPELWMCLGTHGGQRALDSLQHELSSAHVAGRRAACLGLARAGHADLVESDSQLALIHERMLAGDTGRRSFSQLED